MKLGVFLVISLLCNFATAHADTLEVEYSSFYSHLKKLDTQHTPALQFAFGFKHVQSKALCELTHVEIVTQKLTLPVNVLPNNRFILPTEKALRQANAKVVIDLNDNANQCDMSVQLETKPEFLKTQYSGTELTELLEQYALFFDDMGSFLSFLMPSVTGLKLTFPDGVKKSMIDAPESMWDANELLISADWIAQQHELHSNIAPTRITAQTSK